MDTLLACPPDLSSGGLITKAGPCGPNKVNLVAAGQLQAWLCMDTRRGTLHGSPGTKDI